MAGFSAIFCLLFLFAVFIFIRFLVIQNKCTRRPMILFYIFAMALLVLKATEFAILCSKPFFDDLILNVHLGAIIAALIVGIIHSYNLMKLISDLRTIDAKERRDFRAV